MNSADSCRVSNTNINICAASTADIVIVTQNCKVRVLDAMQSEAKVILVSRFVTQSARRRPSDISERPRQTDEQLPRRQPFRAPPVAGWPAGGVAAGPPGPGLPPPPSIRANIATDNAHPEMTTEDQFTT